jgi:hypothetical protein
MNYVKLCSDYFSCVLDIHTYHSRFIPEEEAETPQIFLHTHPFYQNVLATRNTADVTGGNPIVV